MYEGWHIEFGDHARWRMELRGLDEQDVLEVIARPDEVAANSVHGGRLLTKYLPDWDRILVVAVKERPAEGLLLVKTVIWSEAS